MSKLALLLLASTLVLANADVISLLYHIQKQHYWAHLPTAERIFIVDLTAEAQIGQLDHYLHRIGIPLVVSHTRHLPAADKNALIAALTDYLNTHPVTPKATQ